MKKTIVAYSVFCLFILYIVEQVLLTPYIIKTIIKIPMFTLLPLVINHYMIKSNIVLKIKKNSWMFILIWSAAVFMTILAVSLLLKPLLDIESIRSDFNNRMMLSYNNMHLAAVYTILVNSFIEEYFFRGFIFQGLQKLGGDKPAYILSSAAFAVYHVSIFAAWFGIGFMTLMLFGLFIGGLIFSYFVKKTESILAPWVIHISADLALVVFGLYILDLFS